MGADAYQPGSLPGAVARCPLPSWLRIDGVRGAHQHTARHVADEHDALERVDALGPQPRVAEPADAELEAVAGRADAAGEQLGALLDHLDGARASRVAFERGE